MNSEHLEKGEKGRFLGSNYFSPLKDSKVFLKVNADTCVQYVPNG